MEVIIFSQDKERGLAAMLAADTAIADKRLRLMSLHPAMPRTEKELAMLLKPERGYLIVMDLLCCPNWKEIAAHTAEKSHCVSFCLLSDNYKSAAEAVGCVPNLRGYVNTSESGLNEGLEKALVQIYKNVATACGGIMTADENGSLKVISFEDIFYIETIKQKHLCTVYHKKGSDVIRADISKLIKSLDGRFEVSRSSTIANLSLAEKFTDGLLYFKNGDCCSVAAKKVSEIKKAMLRTSVL